MDIPANLGEAFLDWFRARTEAAWAEYRPRAFEDYVARSVGGADWRRGTRWLNGLTEAESEKVERRWGLAFPPDYRLFLRRMHSVDRPMVGAGYTPYEEVGKPSRLMRVESPSFHNWLADDDALRARMEWPLEGLLFDTEHSDLWPPSWSAKPAAAEAREARVRELVAAAPGLIPVFVHRYLLARPCVAGNPVLSVNQSDIIVYGADLRGYLLIEFGDLLGLDRERVCGERAAFERTDHYEAIPFWGELIAGPADAALR